MNTNEKWRDLGWRHPLWDYVRFYSVVQRQRVDIREAWKEKLKDNTMEIDASHDLPVPEGHAELFFDYLDSRELDFQTAWALLRTEEDALAYCEKIGAEVTKVKTRNQDHHQSSSAMVAGGIVTTPIGNAFDHIVRESVSYGPFSSCSCVANDWLRHFY